MRIVVLDALARQPTRKPALSQHVIGVAYAVSALHKNGDAEALRQLARGRLHIALRRYAPAPEHLRFGNVGRYHARKREQALHKRLRGVIAYKAASTRRHHDRVDHDVLSRMRTQRFGNDDHIRRRRHHADFHGAGANVAEHRIYLLHHEFARNIEHA